MDTDFKTLVKLYRVYIILAIVAAALVIWGIWLFRGYAGDPDVKHVITEIKESAKTTERRADDILDSAKAKEANAKHEATAEVSAVSDDGLPTILSGLLADYRSGK